MIRWPLLLLAGIGAGLLLGEFSAGQRTVTHSDGIASFSRLSANPDAMVAQGEGAPSCLDCPDSHRAGLRVRGSRDDRMSSEFRELGAVELDPPAPADTDDGYRYGGRFPDPDPPAREEMPGEPFSTGPDGPPLGEISLPPPAEF
ncbi:hypothetical protein [Sphingopyxis sp. JAI128]|uniref:hypothetical protein n=1 Tax=Sphingopyxis sp. JAI128 TaxID=2723066 RepID=UPI00161EA65F|nr:hypothetical protein [Sphingopyxis sp. JAI128]MBB6424832.1 hypothetical protein [Sphingopyxis sp. JAI128]